MKPGALALLRCPVCRGRLEAVAVHARAATGDLRDGVLACAACGARYPVLGWIARLVPSAMLLSEERDVLERAVADAEIVPAAEAGAEESLRAIEERSRRKILPADLARGMEEQARRDFDYRARHTGEKMKFVRTAAPLLAGVPRAILDVGGGQGGTLSAFCATYAPEHAFLVDLDAEWLEIARLRDPATEVVRADATRLPFADGGIEFLITTATLEHVPDWRSALREFVRVAGEGLVCYGPNGRFPYDFGHVAAPFVTWLPKPAAARVGAAWHALLRTGRSRETVRHQLESVFYVPRARAARELERSGARVRNVFREFLEESVRDEYHVHGGGLWQVLRDHPWLRGLFGRVLIALGMEPNVYLFFRARERAAGAAAGAEIRAPAAKKDADDG
ncbi:MAG TPA: methyltransferase domain-containing protein [Terriglobales bacterium]|nr:methyltransferase domain-containing protein [Terriglobales bacterium]